MAADGTDVFAGRRWSFGGGVALCRFNVGGGVLGRFAFLDLPVIRVRERRLGTVSHIAINDFTDEKQVCADVNGLHHLTFKPREGILQQNGSAGLACPMAHRGVLTVRPDL